MDNKKNQELKKEYNQNEASILFNVSRQYINKIIKENKLTLNKNNKIDYLDLKNYFDNINNHAEIKENINIDKNDLYLRKLKAETEKTEYEAELKKVELEAKLGNFADINFVKNELFNIYKIFNDNLYNLPKKLSPILVTKTTIFEVDFELKKEIERLLSNILLQLNNLSEEIQKNQENIDDDEYQDEGIDE